MRKKSLILAIVFGILAFVTSYSKIVVASKQGEAYVWTRDIPAGELIQEKDLKLVSYPESYLPEDAVRDVKAVAGKYSAFDLAEGDLARTRHVRDTIPKKDVAVYLRTVSQDTPHFAVAAPATLYTTVGGGLKPGDRVDVYAWTREGGGLVLENVEVLQVGSDDRQKVADNEKSVVLSVPADRVAFFSTLVAAKTDLVFALRPASMKTPGDGAPANGSGDRVQEQAEPSAPESTDSDSSSIKNGE